ncbi:tumor necrosis factor receptor superfamily member 5 [Chaetodon auriga]|uniref:tumor necrosis factor receptor superfamily member 5 n=1 Tax=Chaetodon auriga TaxID=39042 RepID=UPI004032E128
MSEMNCTNEDKYISKDGRCCDRCPAGWYRKAECDGTKATECDECRRGFYTATKNHLTNCHVCRDCSPSNNQRKVEDCTAKKDTVCECVTGFYCSNEHCDHCRLVTHCTLGEGVKVRATRTNDTICAPCEAGTYSNVTDFHSPCQTHTRCEDIGRVLKTPGTRTTDVLCGDFKTHCHWILPAGLWSGLVLTALVLFGLLCWKGKRKSYKAASSIVPVTLVEMIPAVPDCPLDLPLPSIERNGYCQESCTVDACDLTLFNPDVVSGSTQDSMDSCHPITPLKASMSFSESSHKNGSAGYCTGNFLRIYSEPQEDEWCGT